MIQLLKNLLGMGPRVDLAEMIAKGATVIDVRSRGEYSAGHAKGSVNIPLDQLPGYVKKLKNKQAPIITCCASGMRSASAKAFLKAQGYCNVHNAGPWTRVNKYSK
jgi:phage shock protein E